MHRPHYNLDAWKEARRLVVQVYTLTKSFPTDEQFGLTSQMRRCAVSIPSNIAEGAGRNGQREFAQFLSIAQGSISELETQTLLSFDLGYCQKDDPIFAQILSVSKLLSGLQKSVRSRGV